MITAQVMLFLATVGLMEAPVLVVKFNPTEPIQFVHECLNVPTLKRSSWGSKGVPGETMA